MLHNQEVILSKFSRTCSLMSLYFSANSAGKRQNLESGAAGRHSPDY